MYCCPGLIETALGTVVNILCLMETSDPEIYTHVFKYWNNENNM